MPDHQETLIQHLTAGENLLVEAFAKTHGEGHVLLACHAAFPMVLTADLVYKIWQNFRNYPGENGERCEIPYVAVSDLLLSPLCQPSGYQRFEMPANLRHVLLAALQDDDRFGKARLHELASFLKHYIEAAYRDADAVGQAIRNAQQIVVDAWLQPEKALQTLTQAFREAEQSPAEQVRLSNLVARFDLQWDAGLLAEDRQKPKQTTALLQYSKGLAVFHKTGDAYQAADLLKGVIRQGESGMMLPLPGEVKTSVRNRLSPPQKGKLRALLIAIDEYHPESKITPLRGCKNDARKLANWLEKRHQSPDSPWSEIKVETLFDEQATLSMLEKRAEMLQNITAEDQVLIYFAGHARRDKIDEETDLICYDTLVAPTPLLTISRFRNLVLSNARQQPYITVMLDAQFTGSPNWLDPMNPKHVVFANTGLLEMGYEISGGEGFFTKYFMEALEQGSGDASNAALFVDTLTGMAQDKLGEQQHPQFYATPLGADRPFLQALDPIRELKRLLRLSGNSLADLRKRLALSDAATKQQWKSALTTFLTEKEKTDIPLFLFVFSDANGDLPGVQEEREQLKALVEAQLQNTTVEAVFLENPGFEEVQTYFTAPEYRNRLHLFHFSGLDKENKPFYEPLIKKTHRKAPPIQQQSNIGSTSNIGSAPEEPIQYGFLLADGLLTFFEFAPWLQYQENLRLAFFNSCFSNQTAAWATQLGAWNAIGTEGDVSDAAATKFALGFYSKWLLKGNALSAAFSEVLEAFGKEWSGPETGAHRSAFREEVAKAPEKLPFQLKSAAWLTTGWRGERFTDYHRIADAGLRALVFEYDTLDISDKRERVLKKAELAQKIGEVINSVVTDKRTLLGPRSSQGLLAGIVNSIRQRPTETDAVVLLELAPMVEQMFVQYEWVEAADGLMKSGLWPEEQKVALEEVLKGFEEGADEDLRGRIRQVRQKNIKIFIAYSQKDRTALNDLRTHAAPLLRQGNIEIWYDGEIIAGEVWEDAIKANLDAADIILLLLSPHALASEYFYSEGLKDALKRHEEGTARVVPVILTDCLWQKTPLVNLQGLPTNMTPISEWPNRDDAWNDVLTGLSDLIDLQLKAKIKEQAEAESRRKDPFYDLMIPVKGSTFEMGDTIGGGRIDEKPVHSVTLSDFLLCKYPVTQGLWKAVMGEGNNPSFFKGNDKLPVENVSWEDVQVFIATLNKKSGQQYRLPTEAEWEYAARGGNQSKGYQYSGSNDLKEVAWYDENSNNKMHPVGDLKPNELGLFDMSGNVWEWCQDWYDQKYYEFCKKNEVVVNPVGPDKGISRVLRGGGYFNSPRYCRAAFRAGYGPGHRSDSIGFRLALQVSG